MDIYLFSWFVFVCLKRGTEGKRKQKDDNFHRSRLVCLFFKNRNWNQRKMYMFCVPFLFSKRNP